jgi:hypothetical protein
MRRRYAVTALVGLVACRFGGPSGNPGAYVTFPEDGGADATASADDEGGPPAPPDDATTMVPGDDANAGQDGSTGDAPTTETPDSQACSATVAICDPIHNTGCNGLQQCDVDPSHPATPTGVCLFASPADASACTSPVFTATCGGGSTCVSGGCRALCFCDTDCPAGQCCSDTSGPTGFILCRPCP